MDRAGASVAYRRPAAHRPRRRVRQPRRCPALLDRSVSTSATGASSPSWSTAPTRMRRACDCARRPLRPHASPRRSVRTLLRLGAYQLAFAGVPRTPRWRDRRRWRRSAARLRQRRPAPGGDDAEVGGRRRRAAELPRLDRRPAHRRARRRRRVAALAAMNEPPPVTERADGYMQDLASQWVAAPSRRGRASGCSTCAPPRAARPPRWPAGACVVAADVVAGRPVAASRRAASSRRRTPVAARRPQRCRRRRRRRHRAAVPAGDVRPGAARRAVLGTRRAAAPGRRPLADHRGRRRRARRPAAPPARRRGAARPPRRRARLQRVHADSPPSRSTTPRPTASRSTTDAAGRPVATVGRRLAAAAARTGTDGMVLLRYRRRA